jgi:hypothetical protein
LRSTGNFFLLYLVWFVCNGMEHENDLYFILRNALFVSIPNNYKTEINIVCHIFVSVFYHSHIFCWYCFQLPQHFFYSVCTCIEYQNNLIFTLMFHKSAKINVDLETLISCIKNCTYVILKVKMPSITTNDRLLCIWETCLQYVSFQRDHLHVIHISKITKKSQI